MWYINSTAVHASLLTCRKIPMREPQVLKKKEREVAPESTQFGYTLTLILQSIWEAYQDKGPVRESTLDMIDAYH